MNAAVALLIELETNFKAQRNLSRTTAPKNGVPRPTQRLREAERRHAIGITLRELVDYTIRDIEDFGPELRTHHFPEPPSLANRGIPFAERHSIAKYISPHIAECALRGRNNRRSVLVVATETGERSESGGIRGPGSDYCRICRFAASGIDAGLRQICDCADHIAACAGLGKTAAGYAVAGHAEASLNIAGGSSDAPAVQFLAGSAEIAAGIRPGQRLTAQYCEGGTDLPPFQQLRRDSLNAGNVIRQPEGEVVAEVEGASSVVARNTGGIHDGTAKVSGGRIERMRKSVRGRKEQAVSNALLQARL